MTGASVVWTDEMKKKASEKMRARREAETPEQKELRIKKREISVKNDPEGWIRRNKKISTTRLSKSEELSDIAKQAYLNKSEEAKKNSLECLKHTPEEYVEMNKNTAEKRKPKQEETNEKIRTGVKIDWENINPEDKHTRIKNSLTIQAKEYTLIDGSVCKFHSSWEASCANVLISLGELYKPQEDFTLGDIKYFADFSLNSKKTIIEVKGHPKAWDRWNRLIFPAIIKHMDKTWKIYIVDRNVVNECPCNYQEFLGTLKLVFPVKEV